MNLPDISVVMSVYNGEQRVAQSIESILKQSDVEFEFIIVNDGSNDKSMQIIESYAKNDKRISLISHDNKGLTQSLIIACRRAQGRYIARQDCGDVSFATRLSAQKKVLDENEELSMVSCATKFVTPRGEHLYTVQQTEFDARDGLKVLDVNKIKGPPHHGSVMFSRNAYSYVGGYRKEFIVAQDIDLWSRLVEFGGHICFNETTLYQAVVEKNSLSSTKRAEQFETTKYIVECMKARQQGLSEQAVLNNLETYNASRLSVLLKKNVSDSNYYYFLGSILMTKQPSISRGYLLDAVKQNPLNWRALLKLTMLLIKPSQ